MTAQRFSFFARSSALAMLSALALVLVACTQGKGLESTPQGSSSTSPVPLTPTLRPSPTVTATATITPTPTLTPTPTPTRGPRWAGTPLPVDDLASLTQDNAPALQLLAIWGKGRPYTAAWSPDGRWLAIAVSTGISLYDVHVGQDLALGRTDTPAHLMRFSPDGQWLLVLADDGVYLWDARNGALVKALAHAMFNNLLVFLGDAVFPSDQEALVVALDKVMRLSPEGEVSYLEVSYLDDTLPEVERVTALALSPDGEKLAVARCVSEQFQWCSLFNGAFTKAQIEIWRIQNRTLVREQVLEPAIGKVTRLLFSPDGTRMAVLWCTVETAVGECARGEVQLWDLTQGKEVRRYRRRYMVPTNLAFSPEGTRLAIEWCSTSCRTDTEIRIWRLSEHRVERILEGEGESTSLVFSPDGAYLAAVTKSYQVLLWMLSGDSSPRVLEDDNSPISDLAFSPDGTMLASAHIWPDGIIVVRRVADGIPVLRLQEGPSKAIGVTALAFSPDGESLLAGGYQPILGGPGRGALWIWDIETGSLLFRQSLRRHTVVDVDFSPAGDRLAVAAPSIYGNEPSVILWGEPTKGISLQAFPGVVLPRSVDICCVSFSPDGNLLAWGAGDGKVRVQRVTDGTQVYILEAQGEVFDVAFSPDGQFLAASVCTRSGLIECRQSAIHLWRVSDGTRVHTLKHAGAVRFAFSPDGTLLATGEKEGLVRLWRIADAALLHSLRSKMGRVLRLAFSPDGKILAVGTAEGTVWLFGVRNGE